MNDASEEFDRVCRDTLALLTIEYVEWLCPACGTRRACAFRRSECSEDDARRSLCREHIVEGCPAYLRKP